MVIDEVGPLSFNPRNADLLFQVTSRRYEKKSLVLTTNLAFQDWLTIVPNASARHCAHRPRYPQRRRGRYGRRVATIRARGSAPTRAARASPVDAPAEVGLKCTLQLAEGRLSRRPIEMDPDVVHAAGEKTMLKPLSAAEFLEDIELPAESGQSSIFVLGTLERRLTVTSQQIRALNLVEALVEMRRMRPGMALAVVGGGAAGLTAAVSAARKGIRTDLFEQQPNLLPLFAGCSNRLLHPNLYDWPVEDWDVESAGLPVLDWRAGVANNVAGALLDAFEKERHRLKLIQVRTGTRVVRLEEERRPLLRWEQSGAHGEESYDAVVLAVGFGVEQGLRVIQAGLEQDVRSYWRDDHHGSAKLEKPAVSRYLVSGVGDGGLIDLLRVRVQCFEQRRTIKDLLPDGDDEVKKLKDDLQEIAQSTFPLSLDEQSETWTTALENLPTPELDRRLGRWLRDDTTAVLVSQTAAWASPASFLLNRLLVSRLLKHPRGGVRLRMGRLVLSDIQRASGGWVVPIGGVNEEFDHVIVRHGRERPFGSFEPDPGWAKRFAKKRSPDRVDRTFVPSPALNVAPRNSQVGLFDELQEILRGPGKLLDLAEELLLFFNRNAFEARERSDCESAYTELEKWAFRHFNRNVPFKKSQLAAALADQQDLTGRCGAVLTARALVKALDEARGKSLLASFEYPLTVKPGRLVPNVRGRVDVDDLHSPNTKWFRLAPPQLPRPIVIHEVRDALADLDGAWMHAALPYADLLNARSLAGNSAGVLTAVLAQADSMGASALLFPELGEAEAELTSLDRWVRDKPTARLVAVGGRHRGDGHLMIVHVGGRSYQRPVARSHGERLAADVAAAPLDLYLKLPPNPAWAIAVVFGHEVQALTRGFLVAMGINVLLVANAGPLDDLKSRARTLGLDSGVTMFVANTPSCAPGPYGFSFRPDKGLAELPIATAPVVVPYP